MSNEDAEESLRGLSEATTFPKRCNTCGTVYESFETFMDQTTTVPGSSGLQYYVFADKGVSLFRNCACDSTLMIYCKDRRGASREGGIPRELFDRLVAYIVTHGIDEEKARLDIANILRSMR